MKLLKSLILLAGLAVSFPSFGQGLKAFKLKNGLSIMIWEDNTKSDVYGIVGVRTGSANDPDQYTGLAHYLEHVMFKGTDKIGSLNWAEEEPLYKEIIAKYDLMADEADPVKKEAIAKEINDLTVKASQYGVPTEYSNLMESMGAKGVNAFTSKDMTCYVSAFPTYQVNKWLEVSSQRFLNPVFRSFQPELETVYEEYNRSQDNSGQVQRDYLFAKAFEGHPYAREILGLPEHLKNPRLGQLIKFYNDWYTPENMVLILVGNINANQVSSRIASTFGRLQSRPAPERKTYPDLDIKGRTQYTAKIGQYPSVALIYKGVPESHTDAKALDIALSLLYNGSQTGLLNKLSINGDVMGASATTWSFREQGRCVINAIPAYDPYQRRFESSKSVEKMLLKAVEQVANGQVEDWIINAIKLNMCRTFDLVMESNNGKADMLLDAFINEEDLGSVLNYKDEVMAITVDDIKRVSKKYLSDNYQAFYIEKGKPDKNSKIKKPGYKAIEPPVGQQSLYAQQFKTMPIGQVVENYIDFSDIQSRQINTRSKLHYVKNSENEVFMLTLRYGVGRRELPKLAIAAELMNNAGVMGAYEPIQLKEEFSKLNISCSVQASDNYLYVIMRGYENNLPEACQLLSRQVLMPKLDERQLSNTIGSIRQDRMVRKESVQSLGAALNQFIMCQDKSAYIDELTDKEVAELQLSELTGDIIRASNYQSDIFYSGVLPFDDVYNILSNNLPLVANEKPSNSPQVRPMATVKENTVYFLPNTDAEQAQIYFYMPSVVYDKKDDVLRDAFNQYFYGGFNGIIMKELREKRSMVYTTRGFVTTPSLPGFPSFFTGFIGTQNDKALEALTLYMDLLRNIPQQPERMDNIKSYLRQEALTTHPDFRSKAETYESNKRVGYTQDPAIENVPKIDALTFEDIMKFYEQTLKGQPIVIGIMGNPKDINVDELKKFGNVIRLTEKKLFNQKDVMN